MRIALFLASAVLFHVLCFMMGTQVGKMLETHGADVLTYWPFYGMIVMVVSVFVFYGIATRKAQKVLKKR